MDLPNPGIDWGLLHCRQILYQLSYQGSLTWDICVFWNSSVVSVKLLFRDHNLVFFINISRVFWYLVPQFRLSQEFSSSEFLVQIFQFRISGSPVQNFSRIFQWFSASFQRSQKNETCGSQVSESKILAFKLLLARNLRVPFCVSWTLAGKLVHNYKFPMSEDWVIPYSNYSLEENCSSSWKDLRMYRVIFILSAPGRDSGFSLSLASPELTQS